MNQGDFEMYGSKANTNPKSLTTLTMLLTTLTPILTLSHSQRLT